ncbi:MAG: hypothetical protein GW783_06615 [Deltaproteobacteria bacterium]|nr:hypothetical protein [Deltaproteobacteria bacterium]OIP65444.1 MAG: hypothetical protein AUK30_04595 [Nitrospirae bacterium CG2_30_70_394]
MTRRHVELAQVAPWWVEAELQAAGPLAWGALFPACSGPVAVELGCGYGLFLRDLAALTPTRPFLGVEQDRGAALRAARKLMLAQSPNARVLAGDAFWAIHQLFRAGEVGDVYVNFPDPWPKRRHARRRYVRQPFVAELYQKMAPGHAVFLATDVAAYADEMELLFGGHPGFVGGRVAAKPVGVASKYELDFQAQGLTIHYLVYRVATAPLPAGAAAP